MTRPTVSQAEAWRPDSLRGLAAGWDDAARRLTAHVDAAMRAIRDTNWTGAAADTARNNAHSIAADADDAARHLVTASVAAQDGADQIAAAQSLVLRSSPKPALAVSPLPTTERRRCALTHRRCSSHFRAATLPSRTTC